MRKIYIIIFILFALGVANAQQANITYSIRTGNITSYEADCSESFEEEYTGYLDAWDDIDGTWVGTGCQTCDNNGNCSYASNIALQTRTNNAYTVTFRIDAWEDDRGGRCSYDDCTLCNSDDCRRNETNTFNIREGAYPSNGTYANTTTWGGTNNHRYFFQYTWKYAGTGNLITPNSSCQAVAVTSGRIRSWSVNMTAGVKYAFSNYASGADTYLRIYGPDGYTIVATGDDNGPHVAGTAASIEYTAASTGTYYVELSNSTRANLSTNSTLYYWIAPTSVASFGANSWNILGYNKNNIGLSGVTYVGNYNLNALSYNTTAQWTNSPSDASGWSGGCVHPDYHTVVAKRQGVPTNGVYAVSVSQHDDNFQFYVGGINQFEEAYCCLTHADVYTGYMDGTTTLEMRHGEGTGGSNQGLTFVQQNLSASVSKTDLAENTVCNGNTGTLTFSNPTGAVASPVFRSNFSTNTGLTTSGSASVTSGYLQLTPNTGSQTGGAIFTNTTNMNASVFRSEFDFRVWDGGGADGFSFNYADMSGSPANNGEGGFGNGLSVCFITYSGAGGPFVQIKYAGVVVGSNVGVTIRDASFRKCVLTVNTSNQLSLSIGGVAVITNRALPAAFQSTDKTNWRFSFGGRTGGVTDSHQIDNLVINAYNQYEYSIDGTTWNSTGSFTGLAAGTYTPRIRNRAFAAYPVSLTNVTITQPAAPAQGTAGTYGTNEWYVSCYNSNNFTGYRGFYKSARSNEFNIGADGVGATSNPASIVTGTINGAAVTGYSGCSISNVDNWSLDARRTGFTCGVYQLEVMGNDDSYTIDIDYDGNGSTDVTRTGACCNGTSLGLVGASPYILNSSSKIKITFVEGTGDAYLDVNFNTITPAIGGGTISGITNGTTICNNTDPGSFNTSGAASGGTVGYLNGGSYSYQWESSTTSASSGFTNISSATGQTYNPANLTATTWFRRKVTDMCGNTTYSNVMQVIVIPYPTGGSIANVNICSAAVGAVSITGASNATQYSWVLPAGFSGISTTSSINITAPSVASATNYTITAYPQNVSGGTTCTGTGITGTISVFGTTISVAAPSGATPLTQCDGGNPDAISVASPTGGNGSYTYQWQQSVGCTGTWINAVAESGGSTGLSFDPPVLTLPTTSICYRLRVTDGCGSIGFSALKTYNIVADPAVPSATKSPNVATACEGQSLTLTGAVLGSGGTGTCNIEYATSTNGGISYSAWSTTLPVITATGTDNRIKIRTNCNALGCDVSSEITYTWAVIPALSLTPSGTNVSCFGGSNGTASVTVTAGGTGTYTYSWYTGGSGNSISGLSANIYNVLVTSGVCSATTSYTVTQPAVLSASLSNVVHDLCQLGLGAVKITVTGGTPPYTISKNPINTGTFSPSNTINTSGGQTNVINISGGSTLNIIITDLKGCVFP